MSVRMSARRAVAAAVFASLAVGSLGLSRPAAVLATEPSKPAVPAKTAAGKAKFPAPDVDQLLKGWGGLAWGATEAEFKQKHPDAKQAEGGRWTAGDEVGRLGGVRVAVEYGFNGKGQLNTLRFIPVEEAAKKTFRASLVAAGVLREGAKPDWQSKGVVFRVAEVQGEPFALAFNGQFKDPAEKK